MSLLDPQCEHETKGRKLASTIAGLASEREAASMTGHKNLAKELQHSIDMTKLAMEWNRQDHEKGCGE